MKKAKKVTKRKIVRYMVRVVHYFEFPTQTGAFGFMDDIKARAGDDVEMHWMKCEGIENETRKSKQKRKA